MLGVIIFDIAFAFVIGLIARFALPGPDPMPPWLTIAIGFVGTLIGTGIVFAIEGWHTKDTSWIGMASFLSAVVLVVIYRHFVQKRPFWGKDAYRYPERGFGVEHYRERLKRAGIDPDQIGVGQPFGVMRPDVGTQPHGPSAHDHPGEPTENPAHYLGLLEELHDSGVLDDTEFSEARTRLLEKLR